MNDEVAHRKKPESKDDPQFTYRYGWAFFFAGSSFMCAMMAAVANISLYIKRYPTLDDMVLIIPGLEKKADTMRSSDDFESELGSQNPTIILWLLKQGCSLKATPKVTLQEGAYDLSLPAHDLYILHIIDISHLMYFWVWMNTH